MAATSDIILRVRRDGEQAIPATARDLRDLATVARAAASALRALGGAGATPNVAGYRAQANAINQVAQAAQAASRANVAPAADPRPLNDLNRQLDAYRANLAATQQQAAKGVAPAAQAAAPVARAAPVQSSPAQAAVVPDDRAIARAEAQTVQFARARAELLRTSGNLSGAERVLAGALDGTTRSTAQTVSAQRRLVQLQQESAGKTNSFASSLKGLAQTGAAALGIGLAADQVVRFGVDSVQAANQLEDVQSSLRIIAKDAGTYSQAIAAATQSQRLFGGSLAENIGDVQSFVLTSRTANVALDDLITVSRQLATLDPGQGLRGANIALRELLSGNPLSLAQRFELPRATLKALTSETATTADRLKALEGFLASTGITAEAVSGRLDNTSQAFRDFNTQFDQLKTGFGTQLADIFEEPTRGLTRLLGLVNGNPQAIAELKAVLSGRGSVTQADVQREQGNVANRQARDSLGDTAGGAGIGRAVTAQRLGGEQALQDATTRSAALIQVDPGSAQAVIELNQALSSGQVQADEYQRRLRGLEIAAGLVGTQADALKAIGGAATALAGDFQIGAVAGASLGDRLTALAGTSDKNRLAVIALANGYQEYIATNGAAGLSAQELAGSIAALEGAQAAQASSAQAATAATGGLSDELRTQVLAQADAATQSRALGEAQAVIAGIGGQVKAGLITAAEGAQLLAGRFGFAADEALRLVNASAAASKTQPPAVKGFGGSAPADIGRERAAVFRLQTEREITRATGSTADKLRLVNQELRTAGATSERRRELLVEQARLQQQQQAEATSASAGGGGGKGLDAGFRADLKLQETAQDKLLQLENERRRLEAQGLTNSTRYKQVLVEIKDTQGDIADEAQRAVAAERERAQAAISADLAVIEDARKRRDEDQQLAAAQRIIDRPQFDDNQRQLAREEQQRIALEREQRALAIADQRDRAGQTVAPVAATPATPTAPGVAGAPPPGARAAAQAAPSPGSAVPAAFQAQLVQITAAAVQLSGPQAPTSAPTAQAVPVIAPEGPAPVGAAPLPLGRPLERPTSPNGQPLIVVLNLNGQELQRVVVPGVMAELRRGLGSAAAGG